MMLNAYELVSDYVVDDVSCNKSSARNVSWKRWLVAFKGMGKSITPLVLLAIYLIVF